MALPKVFAAKKQPPVRHLFALDITEDVITAGLWTVEHNKVKILKTSSPIAWKDEQVTDLVEAADVALSELGKETENIHEVILGLQDDWVEKQTIVDARRPALKLLKEQLALDPVGFVVGTEALVKYLHTLEGGPITAVLVQYTNASLHVVTVKAGKIEQHEVVGRSGETVADLTEAFARVTTPLPPRVIVYSPLLKLEELENERQAIMEHDWQAAKTFLHLPKIEVLDKATQVSAICVAGGSEVAVSLGLIEAAPLAVAPKVSAVAAPASLKTPALASKAKPEGVEEALPEAPSEDVAEAMGFSDVDPKHELKINDPHAEDQPLLNKREDMIPTQEESNVIPPSGVPPRSAFPAKKAFVMPDLLAPFRKMWLQMMGGASLNARHNARVTGKINPVMILLAVLAVLLVAGGGFVAWGMQALRADVMVLAKSQELTSTPTIPLAVVGSTVDAPPEAMVVTVMEKEVSGEQELETSGKKTIGEAASGTVTIYNATTGTKVFPKGTVLTSSNGLKFSLDGEVSVASNSGTIISPNPGKADGKIVANAIGAAGNLPAKTEFTVANFDKSSYLATNDQPLIGGSSREVQAVSKEDLAALETQLTQTLTEQAKAALTADAEGKDVIPANKVTVKTRVFDSEVGEQVKVVKLNMTVAAQGYAFTKQELTKVAEGLLKAELPDTALLQDDKTTLVPNTLITGEGGALQVDATLKAVYVLPVDKESVLKAITGKTVQQAETALRERQDISSFEVNLTPKFVGQIFGKLPSNQSKIFVQVKMGQ